MAETLARHPEIPQSHFFEKLQKVSERKSFLKPEDITPEARKEIKSIFTKLGADFTAPNEIYFQEIFSSDFLPEANHQIRDPFNNRGLLASFVLGNNLIQHIFEDIPKLVPNAPRIIDNKTKEPIEGTQGRALRHLLFVLPALSVINDPEQQLALVKEINTRCYAAEFQSKKNPPTEDRKREILKNCSPENINKNTYAKIPKGSIETFYNYLQNGAQIPEKTE